LTTKLLPAKDRQRQCYLIRQPHPKGRVGLRNCT